MKTLPLSPSGLTDMAEKLRREGRLKEAIDIVERCLEKDPEHVRARLLLGRLLYQEGKILQAIEALRPLGSILGQEKAIKNLTLRLERLWRIRNSETAPAFMTETMAGLLVRQGYLLEAMEIYRQLYLASTRDRRLWDEILVLRERLKEEGSRETQKERLTQELEALDRWIEKQQREL